MLRRSQVRIFAAGAALALLPACTMPGFLRAAKDKDGVTVKQLSADLAYGADRGRSGAAPSDIPFAAPLIELFEPLSDYDFARPPTRPLVAAAPCPEAATNAFPTEEATQSVKGRLSAGTYRWKQEGTIEITGLAKLPIAGFANRRIQNVVVNGTTTSYDYTLSLGLAGTETDTIQITADGVYLTRLHLEAGNQVLDFSPLPLPVKLLSLPVATGEQPSSAAVDPVSRFSLTYSARVGTRTRIDACGTVVDGWQVSGTRVLQALSPNDSRSVTSSTYDFVIAPQLGGLFIADHNVAQGTLGPFVFKTDITSNIARLEPVSAP